MLPCSCWGALGLCAWGKVEGGKGFVWPVQSQQVHLRPAGCSPAAVMRPVLPQTEHVRRQWQETLLACNEGPAGT
jgi:hypothetical protein